MRVACSHVDPSDQRPPVEREERLMPLWLVVGDRKSHLHTQSLKPVACEKLNTHQISEELFNRIMNVFQKT